jgi:uncharacterized membrane protein
MADNIIVAVFGDANTACNAAHAINDLKDTGGANFKLKYGIVVTKDAEGDVSVLESEAHPFRGTKVGAVVGGLIGLLGGAPIAAVAALLGATVGGINDAGMAVLKSNMVTKVKSEMHPETTAVIIEADEENPAAVDDIVAKGGGRVFRKPYSSVMSHS